MTPSARHSKGATVRAGSGSGFVSAEPSASPFSSLTTGPMARAPVPFKNVLRSMLVIFTDPFANLPLLLFQEISLLFNFFKRDFSESRKQKQQLQQNVSLIK